MAAITASCAALRPASVRVSAPRPARSTNRVVLAAARTEVRDKTAARRAFELAYKRKALKTVAFGTAMSDR